MSESFASCLTARIPDQRPSRQTGMRIFSISFFVFMTGISSTTEAPARKALSLSDTSLLRKPESGTHERFDLVRLLRPRVDREELAPLLEGLDHREGVLLVGVEALRE